MRRISTLAAALVLVIVSGCAASARSGDEPGTFASGATLEVTNNNWSEIVVYAVRASTRIRLGSVSSMTTVRFRLPGAAMGGGGDLQLLARPIGGARGYVSPRVNVRAGQRVEMTLQNHLAISDVTVW